MPDTQQKPTQPVAQPGSARIRWLVVALGLVAVASATIAIFASGDARAAFGGVALVFTIAALWSGGAAAGTGPNEPQFDLEGPPPVTPLPQSPVTQMHDSGAPPNKSLERTREG